MPIESYEEVYSLNETMRKFREVRNSQPLYYYLLMNQFLKIAIGSFPECQKDLTSRSDIEYEIYEFEGDGVSDTFTLTPDSPFDENMETTWYVEVDGVVLNDDEYTINLDGEEETIQLTNAPENEAEIVVNAFIIGYFNISDGLSIIEKEIIAELMNEPYIKRIINDDRLLTQTIYSKDEHAYSQANHIRNTGEWLNSRMSETRSKIWRYELNLSLEGVAVRR